MIVNNNTKILNQIKHGEDVFISEVVDIRQPSLMEVGSHVAIDFGFCCSTQLLIGDYVHISPHVVIIGGKSVQAVIGNFCFVAAGTKIVCGSEDYVSGGMIGATIPAKFRDLIFRPVIFEPFSGTGVNCAILPGVILAEGSVIGANSLVTKKTEPWCVYAGNPARIINRRPNKRCYEYAKQLNYPYEFYTTI